LAHVHFGGCDLAGADVSKVRCTDVDLRGARLDGVKGVGALKGATISPDQLVVLAPGLAHAIGLRIVDEEAALTARAP
jgi:hypothetical protein